MNITICGGGSLGLVCAAVLASHKDVHVSLLTGHPQEWKRQIRCTDPNGKIYEGKLVAVSRNPIEVIVGADYVLLCQPGYLIADTLRSIKPYLGHAVVGSIVGSTGFFFFAHELLPTATPLFAFQRTPYIARVKSYGNSGLLLGYKPRVYVATEKIENRAAFRLQWEYLIDTPISLLDSFYEASLTNSNPILHTGRLYSLWHNWQGETWSQPLLFYKEWTDEASNLLIQMDKEFMRILDALHIPQGHIPRLLDYYESYDASSLTKKISSIAAFQTIVAPMKNTPNGWIPDFGSRYFTEDFPYGLYFIKHLADEYHIAAPCINKVYDWGICKCNT